DVWLHNDMAHSLAFFAFILVKVDHSVLVYELRPECQIDDAIASVLERNVDEEGSDAVGDRFGSVLGRDVGESAVRLAEEDGVDVVSKSRDAANPLIRTVWRARDHRLAEHDPLVIVLPQELAALQDLRNIGRVEEACRAGIDRLVSIVRI